MYVMIDTSFETFLKYRSGDNEPIPAYKWICDGLPGGLHAAYVEEVQLPWVKLNIKNALFAGGKYTYYPGFSDIEQFTIAFHEDSKGTVSRWFQEWQERIKNFKTGVYYLPTNYKRDIPVRLMNIKNETIMIAVMKNCWPITKDQLGLTYTDRAGRLRVSINFSTDDQEIEYFKFGDTPTKIYQFGQPISNEGLPLDGHESKPLTNPTPQLNFDTSPIIPLEEVEIELSFEEGLHAVIDESVDARFPVFVSSVNQSINDFDASGYDTSTQQGRDILVADMSTHIQSDGRNTTLGLTTGITGDAGRFIGNSLDVDARTGKISQTTKLDNRKLADGLLGSMAGTVLESGANFISAILDTLNIQSQTSVHSNDLKKGATQTSTNNSASYAANNKFALKSKATDYAQQTKM